MGKIEKKIMAVLPGFIQKKAKNFRKKQILTRWIRQGRPLPPPHQVKQAAIEAYAAKYGCSILVETGTYLGDMIHAEKDRFERIYSIELSRELWVNAQKRFEKNKHIEILNGDSSQLLYQLVPKLEKPAIFWLDGHYSGGITAKSTKECPVLEEIDAIISKGKKGNVLLIDDARHFIGQNDYPAIEELKIFIFSKDQSYEIEVKDDIIRVVPMTVDL